MAAEITPSWDPTGTVRLGLDADAGELTVTSADELLRFRLGREHPERLGWAERRISAEGVSERRVSVTHVVCHCLRELELEQRVIALSRDAARRAARRGGAWAAPARRLRRHCENAHGRRISTLVFRTWWAHLGGERGCGALSISTAALRAGYRSPDGSPDVVRLLRRLGVAAQRRRGRAGEPLRNRTVNYQTGLDLCRALDRDPAELGL